MAWIRPFLLALFLFTLASATRAQGFAVQVASFGSQREAELAVTALRTRRVEANWIKAGATFRVRAGGRFANEQEAAAFATKLVGAGVIASYTVQPYDPPVVTPASHPQPANNGPVDGLSGHALPARATLAKATPAPRAVAPTVSADAGALPHKPAAPRVYADDVNLDDLAEFSDSQLESKIEKKDDRLLLYVRNRHGRNLFRGTVKLTLQDSGKDSAVEPWQFMLKAKEDSTYDLNTVVRQSGSYWVEVLDDRGKTQMIKAASLEPRPAKTEVAQKKDDTPNNLSIAKDDEEDDAPPKNYQMRVASDDGTGAAAPEKEKNAASNEEKEVSKENIQQGDVKVIVRKVAESTENVTLEFEIQAPAPLGMISVAMQTASTTDFKQAIMTTKLGRIPFLVPISDTNGAFNFELKDESGRILASGQKSFQEFKKP
jgi:hypothetical protein